MLRDYVIGSSGGSGKKKGGGTKPTEAPNTLISKSELNALFLLGEGEIDGAAIEGNIYKSTYLDGVPIQNPDGSFNFQGVKLAYRPGTLTQNYINGFSSAESETQVSVQVKKSLGDVVRTIRNIDVDAVRLRFTFPQMRKINTDNNNSEPTSVSFKVDIRTNNGGWVERLRDTVSGKCTSPFERFYRIDLPQGNVWDIRVTRLTDDSQSETLANDLYWTSYTTIVDAKFCYPNSALLGLRIPSDQFSSLPDVTFLAKGKKVLIPNNYDPVNRTYNGVWNGGFVFYYTNNPAWILYDMLINERYGTGERISASALDKWSFYAIAQYCDEKIPSRIDGQLRPRFVCNTNIRDPQQAYDILNAIASSFRGNLYWAAGAVFATQDKPSTPRKQFTKANVLETIDLGSGQIKEPAFRYSHTAKTARHTVAIVKFLDEANSYKPDIEIYENHEGITRYGYNVVELEAFGCTNRDQARRLAMWTVLTELNLTKSVSFKIGSEGVFVRPGDLVQISDTLRSVSRYAGRLAGFQDTTWVFLDKAPDNIAVNDTITINTAVGTLHNARVAALSLSDPRGQAIALDPPLQYPPEYNAVWMLSKTNLKPQLFRLINAADKLEDDPSCYELSALEYNDSIYNAVDFGEPLVFPPTQLLPPPVPNRPFNVTGGISPRFKDGQWVFDIRVSWEEPLYNGEPDPYTQKYETQIRHSSLPNAWWHQKTTSDPSVDYTDVGEDKYFVRVRAIDVLGRPSAWVESVELILKRPIPPNPVGNIRKEVSATGSVRLLWSDSQYYPYGIIGYRIFVDNELIEEVPVGTYFSREIVKPPGVYYITIKPFDRAGGVSSEGLRAVIGEEFIPKNPSGEISVDIREDRSIQLLWTDTTEYNKDFKGYRVYRNGVLIAETTTKFTTPFYSPVEDATFRVYSLNSLNYQSLGYLEFHLGVDTGALSVPNPSGAITKVSSPDGGVILTWTDGQTYTNFGGYRVYINGELVGDTPVKSFPSIIRTPDYYNVIVKTKSRNGLQSVRGLETQITPQDYIPPAPAFMLVQQALNGSKQFYWALPDEIPRDLKNYRLRYNVGTSTDWENSHFLQDVPISNDKFETTLFRQGTYTILLKLVDVTGHESDDFTFTQVNLADPVPDNVVEVWDFKIPSLSETGQNTFLSRSPWQGTTINLAPDSDGNLVMVDPAQDAYYDSNFEVTSSGHLKATEDIEGNYALYYERVTQGIIWAGSNDTEVFWDSALENTPLWKQFNQYLPFPVAVAVNQEEYKVRVHIKPGTQAGKIKKFNTLVDAPDIVESFADFAIASTGSRLKPKKPMNVLKSVNLTLQDPLNNTAVKLVVVDKDPVNGALVEAYNASGNRTSALVDAVTVGY